MIIYNAENSMVDCLENIESFTLFNQGRETFLQKSNEDFSRILKNVEKLFGKGNLMPAFGVSLHNETLNALKDAEWLKIDFDKLMEKNGLKFNSLIFKLEETSGFNMIRLYQNQYEGRCLFLCLNDVVDLKQIIN